MKKIRASFGSKNFQKRAVAPVIATLLLVAIAVVGGSIIFVFSQDFFATAQISGSPQIESVKILGYDATDGDTMTVHDGFEITAVATGNIAASDGLKAGELIGVYLKNDGVNLITLNDIKLAGETYNYVDLGATHYLGAWGACDTAAELNCADYTLVIEGDDGNDEGLTLDSDTPELQPGQEAMIVVALEKDVKIGRDMQFRLTTTNGAMFVSTIQSGQQNG